MSSFTSMISTYHLQQCFALLLLPLLLHALLQSVEPPLLPTSPTLLLTPDHPPPRHTILLPSGPDTITPVATHHTCGHIGWLVVLCLAGHL
jgi:hypothetical protein